MKKWRLLDTGVRPAHENMALDEVLLEARPENVNTLRFLQFFPPAVLVGFHQNVEQEVRLGYCRKNGIDINRRVTGGGAILFDQSQLGWEVVFEKNIFGKISKDILSRKICNAVIYALKMLGLDAVYRPKNDIEINGRKISGTGGTEVGETLLFQGTLLVDFDVDSMLKSLRIPVEKLKDKEIDSFRERITCLSLELGYTPPMEKIKECLITGFKTILHVEIEEGQLSENEKNLFLEKKDTFKSDEWVLKNRNRYISQKILRSGIRVKGGSIRVNAVFDPVSNMIQSVMISGDFLAYPKRAIYDLEAALKFTNRNKVADVILDFFQKNNPDIPDVTPCDFIQAISEALDKSDYLKQGFDCSEANRIFCVNGTFAENSGNSIETFLLPYCAKPRECMHRHEKICLECGECDFGAVSTHAREKGMNPVTIINFEDMIETLETIKARGESGFIGSCCGQFFTKHKTDFEQVGLPGILVDVDNQTCYDLGEEDKAHTGAFEGRTNLDTHLILKVMDKIGSVS